MGKQNWKPGNMLNPVPAVMVSVTDKAGNNNIITVWKTGRMMAMKTHDKLAAYAFNICKAGALFL